MYFIFIGDEHDYNLRIQALKSPIISEIFLFKLKKIKE